MFRFCFFAVCGGMFGIYGGAFAMHAATNAFYLFPGQWHVALGLMVLSITFPIFGFLVLTKEEE